MAAPRVPVSLRPLLPSDAQSLAGLYVASIEDLTSDDYDAGQRAAWAASADDDDAFHAKLSQWLTLVALIDGNAAGFASLKTPDTIEMLYVHPAKAGQGIAATLCEALERLASGRGAKVLNVLSSDTAQGFFAKRGYRAERRGTVALGDEWLGQTAMIKTLGSTAAQTKP